MQTQLYLTPKDHGRELTLEEFEHADGQEGYRYELIDGRLEVAAFPNLKHEGVRKNLETLLDQYIRAHPEIINRVQAPACVIIPGRPAATAPQPDLAAYRDFPVHLPIEQWDWRDISPIVVVEVLSRDNPEKDLERNVELYLEVPSIREYWIIDPREDADRPGLTVYRRRGKRWQRPIEITPGETYTTPLLPGFALAYDMDAEKPEDER